MHDSALQLILHASWLVKAVLLILLCCSVLSWGIIIDKAYAFRRAATQSEEFARVFAGSSDLRTQLATAKTLPYSPLANVFVQVVPELGRGHHPDKARRLLRRVVTSESEKLHAFLIFLATVGATAPFIGLLGTVWGIMNAFRGIGLESSASLAVVAPGIAEALITTAAGLAAAIPAVMAYNYFVARARLLEERLDGFTDELVELFGRKAA